MIRTALRLGVLPLFAALTVWVGVGVPLWQWLALLFLSPFIGGLLLLSFWRLKADPPGGAAPPWARRLAPHVWGVCIALTVSVPLFSWRLHLAFKTAEPRLEQLRAQVQAGEPIVWPQQAGEFEVLDADMERGEVYLYLTREDGESPTTLIRSPSPASPDRKANLSGNNSVVALSDVWVFSEPFD